MANPGTKVTFEEARRLASEAARSEFGVHSSSDKRELLSDFHMEAEGCWFFFKADDTLPPRGTGMLASGVYAVSKSGVTSCVYDFRDNVQQMRDYVEMFSLYSLGKREEANAAWRLFKTRYNVD